MIKVYDFDEVKNSVFERERESNTFFLHCTNNYYEYYFTTINSIVSNTNSNVEIISFFWDYDDVKFKSFLQKLPNKEKVFFHIFKIQKNCLSNKWMVKNFIDRYCRFLMFHSYFKTLTNAMYIDCDIVVNSDIFNEIKELDKNHNKDNKFWIYAVKDLSLQIDTSLFDFSISTNIHKHSTFSNIKDSGAIHIFEYMEKYLKVNKDDYFNFGVFYIPNLKNIKYEEILKIIDKDYYILDQDMGNILFKNKVYFLDSLYNFPVMVYKYIKNLTNRDKNYNECFIYQSLLNSKISNEFINRFVNKIESKDVKVLHFSGSMWGLKPWNERWNTKEEFVANWLKYNKPFEAATNKPRKSLKRFIKRKIQNLVRRIMN